MSEDAFLRLTEFPVARCYTRLIWLSTEVIPGASHAVLSASCLSAQDRTLPLRIALLPCTSTVMLFASTSALRSSASSIFFFRSVGEASGFTIIRLLTPLTPQSRRTAHSTSCLWYCHSTSPLSVNQPFSTVT